MGKTQQTEEETPIAAWWPRERSPSRLGGTYPQSVVQRLGTGWRRLCEDERDSVIAATLVLADLARLGAPAAILGEAARVVEDEVRHVEVCTRVLSTIGIEAPNVPSTQRRCAERDLPDLETKCARELLAGFAVGEAMSAACFAACRRATKDPLIRWALTEVLRDEARHWRFGINAGGWVIRKWSAEKRATLWPACVSEMEAFERALGGPIAFGSAEPVTNRDDIALGMLPPHDTCAAAVAWLAQRILPSLAALGIAPSSGNS